MNQRTQVLIFIIIAFTCFFGMIGWSLWDYIQSKKKKNDNA